MRAGLKTRKLSSILLIAALLAPYMMVIGYAPIEVRADGTGTIVIDFFHGQNSSYVYPNEDADLIANLTDMGYDVVLSGGRIDYALLADADALLVGGIYGEGSAFANSELREIADWFATGNKFLWVGSDSDYGGDPNRINNNMTALLKAVGSHVYPEPTSVEDPVSSAESGYRVIATGTSDDAFVADLVADVDAVLMHGPTCLYGSTFGNTSGAVDLRETSIENVYPVLYYGDDAIIVDADLVEPKAHATDATGNFTAMTVETYAGENHTGIIAVSGASMYGDYKPMTAEDYYGHDLNGYNLVWQTIDWAMNLAPDLVYTIGGVLGAVVVIIIVVAVVMRRE
ncbi:MAG: hypothetical protein ACXADL_15085 [Candidatus Thorarchaeota archaeon]|jgi:hypothetical protein